MTIETDIEVVNKLGLHARAAAKLVKLCSGFKSDIKLHYDEKSVDAKSIMGVMMLAATQGANLKLVIQGEDENQANESVAALFQNYFDEGE